MKWTNEKKERRGVKIEFPCISIVIPVYNGADFLSEAIDSALYQTYPNVEVLVVNDGSDDAGDTERIAMSYGNRIRYFHKENGGVASALNFAIDKMQGEYFSWLSHDDIYYPNKLQIQIEALKICGDMTRVVISDYDVLEYATGACTPFHMHTLYPRKCIENSVFSILQGIVGGCSMLIHKSHFQRVGIFNENLRTTQDYDLWFRMFRRQKLLYVDQCIMTVRVHSRQGSKTITSHKKEQEALYRNFIEALAEEEIVEMYGEKSTFYSQLLCLLWGGQMMKTYRYVNRLLLKEPIPEDMSKKLSAFHDALFALSDGTAKKICIFGAGNWGLRLFHELQCRLVQVDFFCDNNPDKHGYIVEGISCISVEKLMQYKDETLVIVSTVRPESILKQLQELEFPFIVTRQQLVQQLFGTPRIKWMTSLDSIENLNYSSPEILALIAKFKQTIFDVCMFYEDKIKKIRVDKT